MRCLLFLVPFTLAGCPRSSKAVDAGPVASASASATPVAAASSSAPVSGEGPPALPTVESAPVVKLPPRTDISATGEVGKTITIQGVFGLPEKVPEALECSAVRLDKAIEVHEEHGEIAKDGRGLGEHPTIGNAKRICVWSWAGWKASNDGWMIPSGSHVVLRGTVWTPMVRSHPRALLLFDAELLSATPPGKPVPAGKMPDGDTVAYVRKVEGEYDLQLDVAFLYYGAAAKKLAEDRGETLPAGRIWYFVNESTQLRSWKLQPLAPGVEWPQHLTPSSSGGFGWRTVAKSDLVSDKPYLLTIENGALKSFREITLEVN